MSYIRGTNPYCLRLRQEINWPGFLRAAVKNSLGPVAATRGGYLVNRTKPGGIVKPEEFKVFKLWYMQPDQGKRRVSTADLVFIADRPYAVFEWSSTRGAPRLPTVHVALDASKLVDKGRGDWFYGGVLERPGERAEPSPTLGSGLAGEADGQSSAH